MNWEYNMVCQLSRLADFINRPFDVATFAAIHAIGKAWRIKLDRNTRKLGMFLDSPGHVVARIRRDA